MTFRPEGDGDLPLSAGCYGTPVEIRLQASARGFDLGRRDGFLSPVDECERMSWQPNGVLSESAEVA